MPVFLLVALAVALIGVMFALQNVAPVTIAFVTWTFEGSLALVVFVALIAGALASFLASVPTMVRGRWTATSLNKRVAALEAELENCRRTLESAQARASPTAGPAPEATPPRRVAPAPDQSR
jgi:uncharacterized integral membrane protein